MELTLTFKENNCNFPKDINLYDLNWKFNVLNISTIQGTFPKNSVICLKSNLTYDASGNEKELGRLRTFTTNSSGKLSKNILSYWQTITNPRKQFEFEFHKATFDLKSKKIVETKLSESEIPKIIIEISFKKIN